MHDKLEISNPIQIKRDELIVCTATKYYGSNGNDNALNPGVWGYNVNDNIWKCLNKYDKDIINVSIESSPIISYDQNKFELYIYSHYPSPILFSINLLTNQHSIYDKNRKLQFARQPSMLFVNDCIHFICGLNERDYGNLQHIVWDFDSKNIKISHTFNDYSKFVQETSFVHLKKRNELMLLGGYGGAKNILDDISFCDLNTMKWNKSNHHVKFETKLYGYSCVVNKDEEYLICFNGNDENRVSTTSIYILDLNNMKWKKSEIDTPSPYRLKPILFHSSLCSYTFDVDTINIFICGLLKKYKIYNMKIPLDVVNIIEKMYSNEHVHLLQWDIINADKTNHFVIDFEKIL